MWYKALMKRFKKQPDVILARLISKKYTMKDTRNQQELAEYIKAMIYYAKNVNIDTIYNQLTFAYENIAAEL